MTGSSPPTVGFFGKIPTRGDFVRTGLSVDFVARWDRWLQGVILEAEHRLGAEWHAAWRVAPVWRFALPAGHCGGRSIVGVWLPSVDSAGRRFPLTLAAEDGAVDQAFLDAAEEIGRDALAYELAPANMAARLEVARPRGVAPAARCGRWWSTGGPFVAATELELDALPDAACFARMLRA